MAAHRQARKLREIARSETFRQSQTSLAARQRLFAAFLLSAFFRQGGNKQRFEDHAMLSICTDQTDLWHYGMSLRWWLITGLLVDYEKQRCKIPLSCGRQLCRQVRE